MRRRDFIAALGGAAASWPLSARGQTPARLGLIFGGTANSDYNRRTLGGLTQGLADNGLLEGRDYLLETRFAEGDYERFPALARELQQAKVRVIIPVTVAAVRVAQQLTPPIPVVMAAVNDPVGTGLIASLARPGGLTTGTATLNQDVTPKLVEFLSVIIPRPTALAALYNPANPSNLIFLTSLRRETSARGISLVELAFKSTADLESTLATLVPARRPDALQLLADTFIFDQADRIAALALAQRLPTLGSAAEFAYAGALLTYGLSVTELFRRAAPYVKRILEGTNPADLPVEQPTYLRLTINLKTAKALGVDVPGQLLARADEVIE
jgi:putative tryptophan/tyrosine transport system substrate-binding protein